MPSKLRQIRKNFEYHAYLDAQGVHYQYTNSEEIRICCPICGEEDYKLYINDVKKAFICFRCEAGYRGQGDVFNLIAAIEDIPVNVAIAKTLANYRDVTPVDFSFEDEEEIVQTTEPSYLNAKEIILPSCVIPISKENDKTKKGYDYLIERGLTDREITILGTGYVPFGKITRANGKTIDISKRVLFPVYGGQGHLVSWLARHIDKDLPKHKPKYINAPDSDMAMTVWPFVRPAPGVTEAVLVEGLLDCLAVRRAGACAYAMWGKKLSVEQITYLKECGFESISIFFDRGAEKEANSTAEKLRLQFKDVYIIDNTDWPKDQDSGSLLKDPNGVEILKKTLANKVNINNDMEVLRWTVKIKAV